MTIAVTIIGSVLAAVLLAVIYIFVRGSFALYVNALVSGARANVGLFRIAKLRLLEKVPQDQIEKIVHAVIMAGKADVFIDTKDLEAHNRAGGDIEKVVKAMIAAKEAGFPMTFSQAREIDLASERDVLDAVKMRIKPVVIDMPIRKAVAGDGIELKVHCRITLRTNIDNYLKGANQETILARVGDGVESAIGMAARHQDIIANPFFISERIMGQDRDLDKIPDIYQNSGFEVLSIDVADVDLGRNVNARLELEKAEADIATAKAQAQERRAIALEKEKEMKVRVDEMKANIKEAEALIPIAIAEVLSGKTGLIDGGTRISQEEGPAAPDE